MGVVKPKQFIRDDMLFIYGMYGLERYSCELKTPAGIIVVVCNENTENHDQYPYHCYYPKNKECFTENQTAENVWRKFDELKDWKMPVSEWYISLHAVHFLRDLAYKYYKEGTGSEFEYELANGRYELKKSFEKPFWN